MDKEITQEVSQQNRKKAFFIILAVAAVLALLTWLLVKVGDIENTINATGEVLPEFEEILTSPINASIKSVSLDEGSKVNAGQSILSLDKTAAQNDYDKQNFQLESKQNEIEKLRLDLKKSFFDIQSNNDIKQLHISDLTDAVENAKRLYAAGGGTRESIEQAELNLKIAQLEKKQIENEITNKQQTMQIEIKEAELAADVMQNDLNALRHKLDLADIIATRAGVVTYVNKNIGANIKEGDALARIADLSSFKVQGSISDEFIDQLHNGMPVIVLVADTRRRGHVVNISPSVKNSIINFDIQLEDRNNKALRPNMKVDVYLVTAAHSHVMMVDNGAAFKGANTQDIFILNKGEATRRTVHTGLSNFDDVELKDGVKPGDVVITSDMSAFKNSSKITVENE
jgi:HlyD family secretion protein